jgi:hypothetical protein
MALVKRLVKGSTLTYQEMDDNLSYLDNKVSGSSGYITRFSGSTALTSSLLNQIGSTVFVYGSFNVSQSLTVNNSSVVTLAAPSYYIATGSVTASVSINNYDVFSVKNGSAYYALINDNTNNTSFGGHTIPLTATGTSNTSLGGYVLGSLTSGLKNTGVGYSSLLSVTQGNNNVAVGNNTLIYIVTESFNTAIGANAGENLNGQRNTLVGNQTLTNSLTGSNNTVIGNTAGFNNYGNNNVFLGHQAGYNEAGSNTLYIANNSGSSPLIKGNFSTGLLQFNTPTGTQITGSLIASGSARVTGSFAITGSGTLNNCTILTDCDTGSFLKTTSTGFGNTSYYGSFYHTSSQLTSAPNTPTPVSMSSTDFAYGISISGSNSDKIKFASGGYYDIQFSAQMAKTTGTSATAYFWIRRNEIDVPWTNTGVTLAGGSNDVATPAWNFFVSASSNDYYQLMFSANTTNPFITSSLSVGGGPEVPSIIVTVNRVG